MEQENPNFKKSDTVFTKKIRAGKRRTYFFDIRSTKANDFFITITESKKRFNGDGYDRHKIFLYKEDFNKFLEALGEGINKVKDMMPGFNFDEFDHKDDDYNSGEYESGSGGQNNYSADTNAPVIETSTDELPSTLKQTPTNNDSDETPTGNLEEVDKW